MNIFVFNECPVENARQYCNRHLVKMITEHVQMMTTVCAEAEPLKFEAIPPKLRMKPFKEGDPHRKHPCTLWLFKSQTNYDYLWALNMFLHEEWRYRYDHPKTKIHEAYRKMLHLPDILIDDVGLTPFAQAMPEKYQQEDVFKAYQEYFMGEKMHIAHWKKREEPEWFFLRRTHRSISSIVSFILRQGNETYEAFRKELK